MTLRSPASWIQGGSHSAENDRLTERSHISAAGVVGTNDLAVSANGTPNMSVNVAAGAAYVAGSLTTTQGYYKVYNDATVNLSVAAADATNPRIDLVVLQIEDAQYSGANNDALLKVVTGTPAASPSAPAAPANSYVLAQIAVAANATSVTSGNITDKRSAARTKPVVAQADATSAPAGRFRRTAGQSAPIVNIEDENGNTLAGFDSSGRVIDAPVAWTTYSPTVTASTTNPSNFGDLGGRYRQLGKSVFWEIYVQGNSTMNLGSGVYSFTLPTGTRNDGRGRYHVGSAGFQKGSGGTQQTGVCVVEAAGGQAFTVWLSSTAARMTQGDWAADLNYVLVCSGVYEAA